jgi:predicted lipid-binding transport protein (Tim44 family)
MKTWLVGAVVAGLAASFVPFDAEARRFGGGKPTGMQRDMPARQAPDAPAQRGTTPAQQAAPSAATAPAAGAAAAARPAWLAPVAGLAAGLGLVALASALGFGEGLANFIMMALLVLAGVFVVRWLMRSFGAATPQPATATAGAGAGRAGTASPWSAGTPAARQALPAAPAASGATPFVPADFDREGFERIAKMIFIRMQAAHDAGDLDDLRQFTTPEVFASVRLELQERGAAPNHTDVVQVDAEVLDVTEDAALRIVSVRFHGLIREDAGGAAHDFDEVWHLVKPHDDRGSWAIAGIQPLS